MLSKKAPALVDCSWAGFLRIPARTLTTNNHILSDGGKSVKTFRTDYFSSKDDLPMTNSAILISTMPSQFRSSVLANQPDHPQV